MAVTSWIRRSFRDGVVTTATVASMSAGATSFTVNAGGGSTFPDGSVGPFIVCIDQGQAAEEKVLVQSRSADVFTVAASGRGYNGTTAQTHTNGSVLHTIDAQDLDEANQVAAQTLGAIAASGDLLVGSAANTLARLARGAANSFLQAGASTLSWVGFGVSQSTISAVGDVAADGTQTTPARSDHRHGREAFATNAVVLGTAASPGVATTLIRSDDTIAAFDATAPTTSAVGDAAAVGAIAFAARRDHKHGREAFATPVATSATANAAGSATTIPRSDHVHLSNGTLDQASATSASSGTTTNTDWFSGSGYTADGTERVKITFFGTLSTGTADTQGAIRLMEGATVLQVAEAVLHATGGPGQTTVMGFWEGVPSAGAHTYKLNVQSPGGVATITGAASATSPAFLMVERAV